MLTVDVSDSKTSGAYKQIERAEFHASREQIKKGPEFKTDPKRDSTQSPLD